MPPFQAPQGVAVARNRGGPDLRPDLRGPDLFVVDAGSYRESDGTFHNGALFRIRAGGRDEHAHLSTLHLGPPFQYPVDVAVAPNGDIFVADAGRFRQSDGRYLNGALFRVRQGPIGGTGARVELVRGGRKGKRRFPFKSPTSVEVAADGEIFLLDAGRFRRNGKSYNGALFRLRRGPRGSFGGAAADQGGASAPEPGRHRGRALRDRPPPDDDRDEQGKEAEGVRAQRRWKQRKKMVRSRRRP